MKEIEKIDNTLCIMEENWKDNRNIHTRYSFQAPIQSYDHLCASRRAVSGPGAIIERVPVEKTLTLSFSIHSADGVGNGLCLLGNQTRDTVPSLCSTL